MKIKVYNIEGKAKEEMEVSEKVFALPQNNELIHQVYEAISSNQRQVLAHTKTRGERAGSGIKPWKQKGTGRARVGSVRNPAWKKGGVAFGPRKDRNFKKSVNKKMNQKAIAIILSGKLKDGELFVIDNWKAEEKKTKKIAGILKNLKIKGSNLLAFSEKEKDLRLASRNLAKSSNVMINQLGIFDMLKRKNLIMSRESVKYLDDKYKK